MFGEKLNVDRLQTQLQMLPDAIKTAFSGTEIHIKMVSTVRILADAFNHNSFIQGMFTEVNKVLRAYLTFPVSSATAERSFSSLRRLKTFLRSSMSSQRLNNLFLLYVHKKHTEAINLIAVAKKFVAVNTRRQNYFGNY